MFGIIYLTYGAIISGLAKVDEAIRDTTFKRETYDASTGLYHDSKMQYYDSTMGGRQVFVNWNNGAEYSGQGRILVKDLKTNQVLRDLTQEMMDRELAEAKAHPDPDKTVVRWNTRAEEYNDYNSRQTHISGARYKDIQTGDVYVVRNFYKRADFYTKAAWSKYTPKEKKEEYKLKSLEFPTSSFYMNIKTGMLVRVVDGLYKKYRENLEEEDKYSSEKIDELCEKKKECDDKWIETFNKEQQQNIEKGLKEKNLAKFYCNEERW